MGEIRRGIIYKSCIKRGFIREMQVDFDKAKAYLDNAKKWLDATNDIFKNKHLLFVFDGCYNIIYNVAQCLACADGYNVKKIECAMKYMEEKHSKDFEGKINLFKYNTLIIMYCNKQLFKLDFKMTEEAVFDLLEEANVIYEKAVSVYNQKKITHQTLK